MSSSATSSTFLSLASLSGMPRDNFTHLGRLLDQRDLAAVAGVDRMSNAHVQVVRNRVKHLDISFKESSPNLVDAVNLTHALRLHPNFNSIDISGYKLLPKEACLALRAAFKARDMITIIGRGTEFEPAQIGHSRLPAWTYHLLCDVDHVIVEKQTPSTLQHLDLEGVVEYGLTNRIRILASRCNQLKTLIIPKTMAAEWERGMNLISVLPPTLELLGPNWAAISDELATVIMGRFIPQNIRRCDLTFENDKDSSIEKRSELLQFLPFESMTQITLAGTRCYDNYRSWPDSEQPKHLIISAAMLQHIASRLTQNAELKTLNLTGLMIGEESLTDAIVQLINSIQSPKLEELILLSQIDAIPDMTPILEALTAKLPQWPNIRTIQIVNLSMKNLLPAPPAEEVIISDLLQTVNNPPAELTLKFYGAKNDLNASSIPSILAHYVRQHNQADPTNPLTPANIIQAYKALAPANQNTNWIAPVSLVELVLEPGLRLVKQQQGTRIRAEQDAEYEQMVAQEATSSPSFAEASSSPPASVAAPSAQERREILYAATRARLNGKDAS